MTSSWPRAIWEKLLAGPLAPLIVSAQETTGVDAFGRLRVSTPSTLFDSAALLQDSPLIWETKLAGSGTSTYLPDDSTVDLTVTASSSDRVVSQTRQYLPYQPSKSQSIIMTMNMNETDNLSFMLRSNITGSVVDDVVLRANWDDPMDGSGLSELDLDLSKTQILWFDLEWLGTGDVRCGFFADGFPQVAHTFKNANVKATTYMKRASLPVRYEVVNDATDTIKLAGYGDDDDGLFLQAVNPLGAATLKRICSAVSSEGGFEEAFGVPNSASNGVTPVAVTTRRPVLSIRPKLLFNSQVVRGLILPDIVGLFAATNVAHYEVVWGGVLTGGTPTWISANDQSIVEYNVDSTGISGGISFAQDYVAAASPGSQSFSSATSRDLLARLPLTLDIDGAHPTTPFTDVLSLVATSLADTSNVNGHISWKEIR